MTEETIFTKIVKRELPSSILFEDEDHIVILSIEPVVKGHALVIPKKAYENITDMPEEEYVSLQRIVHKMTKHYREIFKTKVSTVVYGMDVMHVHVHIFPITDEVEIFDFKKVKSYLPNEMEIYKKRLEVKEKW